MEGIETLQAFQFLLGLSMSVGAPTWRGLKLRAATAMRIRYLNVSRCPDMEGIETLVCARRRSGGHMSVGAPTWRGLKPERSYK